MKIQKKHLSAAISLALTLTIAISIMALPISFGQEFGRDKINMTVARSILPNPVGVGQSVMIQTMIYPTPLVVGDVYHNLNFTINAPNGTKVTSFLADTNVMAEYDFTFTADKVGTWRVTTSWAGDDNHNSISGSSTWTVQADPVPPQGKIDTQAYVSTSPKEYLQLGKSIYIIAWVCPPRELNGGLYPNITVTITKPTGGTDTLFAEYTNSEASRSFTYLPAALGEYTVTMSYPGYNFQNGATSEPWKFIVQEGPTPEFISAPLPTGPWAYPINTDNSEWWQYSQAWTKKDTEGGATNWNAYVKAPKTPHVLYKVQTSEAGLIGGKFGAYGVQLRGIGTGATIEGKSSQFVAAHGRLYYTMPRGQSTAEPGYAVLICLDLFTGETIYEVKLPGNGTPTTLFMEQDTSTHKVDAKTGTQVGGGFCLWASGTSMWEIDPFTGNTVWYMDGRTGSYYDHSLYFSNYNGTSGASQTGVMTRMDTRTKDVEWTKTGITGNSFTEDGYIYSLSRSTGGIPIGEQLKSWNATTGEPIAVGPIYSVTSSDTATYGYGMVFQHCLDLRTHAFSLDTGKEVWVSEPMEAPWGVWSSYGNSCGDGLVFMDSFDGHLYGYDVYTGETKFKMFTENTSETAMGHWSTWSQSIIGDSMVWFSCGEHTPPNPMPRGGPLICANYKTGEKLWTIHGFYNKAGVTNYGFLADGVLGVECMNEGNIWCFGRGPSATTISGPATVALGQSVTLEGSVTDQANAITSYGYSVKGTPCVSDESMPLWTEYLFTGKAQPTNATGVPVWLFAMTEDGSIVDITHVTTDTNGHYAYTWTPPEQMTYKVFASFQGTQSYYESMAESAVGVTPATAEPEPPAAAPDNTMLLYGILGAVIAALIIGIVAVMLVMRKR